MVPLAVLANGIEQQQVRPCHHPHCLKVTQKSLTLIQSICIIHFQNISIFTPKLTKMPLVFFIVGFGWKIQ